MSEPTTYTLSGENIITTSSSNPLYHLSNPLSSLTHRTTSIQFSRIPNSNPADASSLSPTEEPHSPAEPALPLYNLIHPSNAQYRTDIPSPFYLTATSSPSTPNQALGNIKFPPSFAPSLKKKYLLPFHKPSFTAFLNPGSSSTTAPLFPSESERGKMKVLFTAKPSRMRRSWEWLDGEGRVVAREEGDKDKQEARLVVLRREEMKEEELEALLALWVLRLWWGVAEEREFQKEALMELTPPEAIGNMRMSKMNKRAGALGGFAAAGGAC